MTTAKLSASQRIDAQLESIALEDEAMTQPEVSMTPEECLAVLNELISTHGEPCYGLCTVVSSGKRARAAVAELASENERARGALDGAVELAARLADERDALRRRVEELEREKANGP